MLSMGISKSHIAVKLKGCILFDHEVLEGQTVLSIFESLAQNTVHSLE
jgi:hypothetical protein